MIVPTLEDLATMSAKVISSGAWEWESRKVFSGQGDVVGDDRLGLGGDDAVLEGGRGGDGLVGRAGLEHVGDGPVLAPSGLLAAIWLGSKVGMLAMASTSPVRGLITTTEPALALCWRTAR